MGIYLYPNNTETELKNAYIGDVWTPDSSRTLLYLPLESNTTDYSGNNRTCTPTSVSFTTVGGVKSAHVGTTGGIAVTPTTFITHSLSYKTTSCLIYCTDATSSVRRSVWEFKTQNACGIGCSISPNSQDIQGSIQETDGYDVSNAFTPNTWIHIVDTSGDGVHKIYINGELKYTGTYSSGYAWGNRPNSYQQSYTIMNTRHGPSDSSALNGNAREIIFENILWSATDVSNYYSMIKQKLGF